MVTITIEQGSIVNELVDAIIIPSNTTLSMTSRVAKALREIGGNEIEDEAISYAPIPIGEAILTGAGDLRCSFIIHAPIMEFAGHITDFYKVKSALEAAFALAEKNGLSTLALPGFGCNLGGIPVKESARAFFEVVNEMKWKSVQEIVVKDVEKKVVVAYKNMHKKA
ncbi:MAG: macro domain-containing protein [Nanoarchaeota archaeon]